MRAKTMAFGGVATGNMNAQLALSAAGTISSIGCMLAVTAVAGVKGGGAGDFGVDHGAGGRAEPETQFA